MATNFKTSLPVRIGVTLGSVGVVFVCLSSIILFMRGYRAELDATDHRLRQLAETVKQNAAIATYLGDEQLASEVVDSLIIHDSVAGASVSSKTGLLQSSGELALATQTTLYRYSLNSPFPPAEEIGEILINPDHRVMRQQARQSAFSQALNLSVYTLFVISIGIVMTQLLLSRPIRLLARQFHAIEPGSDQRLSYPRWHRDNEIGELVDDCNHLLSSVSATLERERQLRAKIETLEHRFRLIFVCANSGIVVTDTDGRLLQHNPAFDRIVGLRQGQANWDCDPKNLADFFADPAEVLRTLRLVPHSLTPLSRDFQLPDSGVSPRPFIHCLFSAVKDESNPQDPPLIEAIIYDVSERIHRERQTRLEAERDALTGLYNRRAGERRMRQIFEQAQADGSRFALLILDLDCFKPINDTHGHEAGDRVLIEISRRLEASVREDDILVRWGGDEFLILTLREQATSDPGSIANRILDRLNLDIELGNNGAGRVGASIGIALFPDQADSLAVLIDAADRAMYQVKNQGRHGYCFKDRVVVRHHPNAQTDARQAMPTPGCTDQPSRSAARSA